MTELEVKTIVREHLNDTEEDYRFSDEEIESAITDAVYQLTEERPDCLLSDAGAINSADITNIPVNFRESIVSWVCYRMFLKDSEDTHNASLASLHFKSYKESIS